MFTITDTMKKRCEENKSWLESQFTDTKISYAIAFCSDFWKECKGNFDVRGVDEQYYLYVWDVAWMTVVIDWDIRRDTIEEFLDYIEDLENKIINLNEKFLPLKK